MRITISKKVFLIFFILTSITLLLGVSVYLGIAGLRSADDEIIALKDFQLQVKELESLRLKVISGHAPPGKDAFVTEINKAQRLIEMMGGFRSLLSAELQARLRLLKTYVGYYRDAYLELFDKYASDRKFPRENAALSKTILKRIERLPSNIRPEISRTLKTMLILRVQAYHDRDAAKISEMKKLRQRVFQVTDDPETRQAIRRFVLNVEANYLNFLCIKDREEFLEDTVNHFSRITGDTISAISHDIQKRQTRLIGLIIALLVLSTILTITLWYLSSRYFRRFLGNMNRAIEAIKAADYDYALPSVSDDEIGDLTLFIKNMSNSLKENLQKVTGSEKKLKEAQQIAHLGHWELDLITNTLYWSDEIFRIFDLEPQAFDASYEAFLDTIHPDDREFVDKTYTDSLKNKTTYDIVHRLLMKDGTVKHVNERCQTEYDEDGNPLHSLGTVQDITENRLAEEALQKAHDQLEERVEERTSELKERMAEAEQLNRGMINLLDDLQAARRHAEKMAGQLQKANQELESFSYSVSHDLKAPLRAIDGYSKILEEEYADNLDEEGRRFFNNIREGARQMNQLIDDLLKYSRIDKRKTTPKKIHVGRLVEDILKTKAGVLKDKRIATQVNLSLTIVIAEPEGFSQALENIVENAIKFTRKQPQPEIVIDGRETDKDWIISISDNGIGFDMKYHDKLFEIFHRLERREDYPGTGVGLAIVKKVMDRMGGRVWAEAQPGQGATFFLSVPK